MKYNEASPSLLDKDILTQDEQFLKDASSFLYDRNGEVYTEPEEVYERFIEHMRFADVNEVTTYQDLDYARKANDDQKLKFARLLHTYDKMNLVREDDDVMDYVNRFGDYAEGIITAPSTLISFFSAGTGKAAAVAGQQVAKAAVRKTLLSDLTKRGLITGAAVEGTIGGVQAGLQQGTRAVADEDYEFSTGQVAATVGLSTLSGGVFGGLGARGQTKKAIVAERRKQIGAEKVARADKAANELAEKTIENADDAVKRPISKLLVEAGDDIRADKMSAPELTLLSLDDTVKKRIFAGAIELAEQGKLKPIKFSDGTEETITEVIARGIAQGDISDKVFVDVMNKYKLNSAQFALLDIADVSRAARTLNARSQIARVQKMAESIGRVAGDGTVEEGALARTFKATGDEAFGEADIQEMSNFTKILGQVGQGAQGFEQMRRGLLTTQLQTTIRNIQGGGMRVFVDEFENLSSNTLRAIGKSLGFKIEGDTTFKPAMMKYMWNRSEAQVIADSFSSAMPREAQRLFAQFVDAADATELTGAGGAMARFGRKMNFLNMHADNYFKKAIFAGQLERLTQGKFNKSIVQMMQDGEMDKITTEMYRDATNKAYELLYQKTPSNKTAMGKLGNAYLNLDKQAGIGMLTGLVMPFPRFIFNQLQFMSERAPLIGLAMTRGQPKIEQATKQLTGLGMLSGFAVYRATQGPETNWYEYTDERGRTTDLRPALAGLSPFLYLGDLTYRYLMGYVNPSNSKIAQDVQEIALGQSLRVGAGNTLFDRMLPEAFDALINGEDMTVTTSENIGKLMGDYFATFAYNLPTGLARDAYALYDDELAIIETNGEVTLWDAMVMRTTRGLPQPIRDRVIRAYNEDIPIQSRPVIEKAQDTRPELPLATSFTGLNVQAPKSALEKELVRLNMSPYEIYRPNRFGPVDVEIRKQLGDVLNEEAVKIMNTEEYSERMRTDRGRRQLLKNKLKEVVRQVSENAFDDLRRRVRDGEEKRFSEKLIDQYEFETAGNKDQREEAVARFKDENNLPEDYVIKEDDYRELYQYVKAISAITEDRPQFFEGGLVDDPLALSETAEEEDPETRRREGEDYLKQMTELGLDLAPVTGEIRSGQGAVEDFKEGNYGMATLGAIGAVPIVGAPARKIRKVLDAAERFADKKITDRVNKTMERKDKNNELKALSDRDELPAEFSGLRLNDEVDIPGVASGRIGRVYYDREGNAMINIATGLEDNPLVGVPVTKAVEKGVVKTKEAPIYKTKVNTAKDPSMEFVARPYDQMLREAKEADPKLYEALKTLENENQEEFAKQVFEFEKDKWLQKTGKTPNTEVTERNKIMQNAANQVKEGKLDIEEFRKIADQHKPVKVWDNVPEMATYEDMFFALDAKKRQSPFVGYNARIPEGTRMTSRLDIPAYTSSDTWVVTLKGDYNDGKNMYAPAVRLKNVDLNQSLKNQEKALGVAAGKAKGPFAVMEGDYVEETAKDTYRLAQEALESGEWTQVGYDPTRRGFFYDRETMEPVMAAEEILQVGPMVLAKKAVKGDPKDFKFNRGGLMARK